MLRGTVNSHEKLLVEKFLVYDLNGYMLELSIVIPTYNEENNIKNTLHSVQNYLVQKQLNAEILVVDDGSTDGTQEILRQRTKMIPMLRIQLNAHNHGKGYVIRQGILSARGRLILFMDADHSAHIRELDKLTPYIRQEYDIVMGSRRLKDPSVTITQPKLRHILGEIYILLARVLLWTPSLDYNCGFKLFKRDSAQRLFSKQVMNDWSFDVETFLLAKKLNLKIKEVSINWSHGYASKVKPLYDGLKSFLALLKLRFYDMQGRYKVN